MAEATEIQPGQRCRLVGKDGADLGTGRAVDVFGMLAFVLDGGDQHFAIEPGGIVGSVGHLVALTPAPLVAPSPRLPPLFSTDAGEFRRLQEMFRNEWDFRSGT